MPKSAEELQAMHFTRDPALAGDIADAFGGGGGDATALIQANTLRYPEDLTVANDLGWNQEREDQLVADAGGRKAWYAEVADAAGIEKVAAATVRGEDYVVFAFELPDGRVGKDVLYLDEDGHLTAPERQDTPERAALRAQAVSVRALRSAQSEADQIVAAARAEAERMLAEAGEKVREAEAKQREAASNDDTEDSGGGRGTEGGVPAVTGTGQTGGDGKPVPSASDIDAMDLETAKSAAEHFKLDVKGTGANGTIKKSDYHNALKEFAEGQGQPQA